MTARPEPVRAGPAARPTVRLLPGRHRRLKGGHPWVYSNEIAMDPPTKALAPGALVRLVTAAGEPLGTAMFNARTLIAARLLSTDPEAVIDRVFFERALGRALALRERLYAAPYYRLVHAEGDFLPGLIVDRYGDVAVCQINTAGMELLGEEILAALDAVLAPRAVILRNTGAGRRAEGLEETVRVARGALDGPITLVENDATFFADAAAGQKTGWFFDQRDSRAFVAGLARGRTVLDLYTYAGGFAVLAALHGAKAVTAIDRSDASLALAIRAAEVNGVASVCHFEKREVFAHAAQLAKSGERFDVVVADPPAFVKSKKDLAAGARGYRKLARLAASLVAPEGVLFIASCSHNVGPELFVQEVRRGLAEAKRAGRILRAAGAGPDHPVHPFLPETAYLKSLTLALD
ncbi:MAG TPA: class I SAM-dependent rRNA methyltransferase [Alphaproteobacteria bacterium]|jgi:23S rRNA (cytosine1962-C5)-methyltransferase